MQHTLREQIEMAKAGLEGELWFSLTQKPIEAELINMEYSSGSVERDIPGHIVWKAERAIGTIRLTS